MSLAENRSDESDLSRPVCAAQCRRTDQQPSQCALAWLLMEQQATSDLADIIQSKDAMLARIAAHDARCEASGLILRSLTAAGIDPATLALLDAQRKQRPIAGVYTHEFWFARLREYRLHEAQAHCEHSNNHGEFAAWHDHCPQYYLPLTKPPMVKPPQAEQTMLPFSMPSGP